MRKSRLHQISQIVPALWLALALLLSACGATTTKPAETGFTAAVQLPATQVITGDANLTNTASTPATSAAAFTPEVTSTVVVAATPSVVEQPTATPVPP